jgi:hypothetical protein
MAWHGGESELFWRVVGGQGPAASPRGGLLTAPQRAHTAGTTRATPACRLIVGGMARTLHASCAREGQRHGLGSLGQGHIGPLRKARPAGAAALRPWRSGRRRCAMPPACSGAATRGAALGAGTYLWTLRATRCDPARRRAAFRAGGEAARSRIVQDRTRESAGWRRCALRRSGSR